MIGDRAICGEDNSFASSTLDGLLDRDALLDFDSLRGTEGRRDSSLLLLVPDEDEEVAIPGADAGGPARMISRKDGPVMSSSSMPRIGVMTAARASIFGLLAMAGPIPPEDERESAAPLGEGGPARKKSDREENSSLPPRATAARGWPMLFDDRRVLPNRVDRTPEELERVIPSGGRERSAAIKSSSGSS
jgi:hypothetical protein